MSVVRKIELARQIEEQKAAIGELTNKGGRMDGRREEQLSRRQAILTTLEWCREHEHEIRAWMAERNAEQSHRREHVA